MEFRPCIDIHNGKVKQIVGSTLLDQGDFAQENFVAQQDAAFYADFYQRHGLSGGHVIMLNAKDSSYYQETKRQALLALAAYPGGLQVGGGICPENAAEFLKAGASHVIVTSYAFSQGQIHMDRLQKLRSEVGREHVTLDLSCRKKEGSYYVVTDRWQNFTDYQLTNESIAQLAGYCDEFLIHAADVEGKASGIEVSLIELLASAKLSSLTITYAGGIGSYDDIRLLKKAGHNQIHVTIGSALDLFGGALAFEEVLKIMKE